MPNDKVRIIPDREELKGLLRAMPDLEPDPGFTARLMRSLPQRKPSLWLRLRLWATRPLTISFTPARLAPVAALALAAVLVFRLAPLGTLPPTPATEAAPASIHFVLQDQGHELQSVAVLGSFNGWRPGGFEMRYDESAGAWSLNARLPQGNHEYVFLVNGAMTRPDPKASFSKDDGFGQKNSVLMVDESHAL